MSRLHGVRPIRRRGRGQDETDQLLSALGGRRADVDVNDPLAQELRAFVTSVDDVVAGVDPYLSRAATTAPMTVILPPDRPVFSPMRRRVLLSAAMSAVLIAAAGGLVVANHKSSSSGLKLSSSQAAVESTKLLDHAGRLLAAAKAAPAPARSSNVAAARADLVRTAQLLPAVGDDPRREGLGHRLDALSLAAGLPPPPGSPGREPGEATESEHGPESQHGPFGENETERESRHPIAGPSGVGSAAARPSSQRGRPSDAGPSRGGPPPTVRPTTQPTLTSSFDSGSGSGGNGSGGGGTPGGSGGGSSGGGGGGHGGGGDDS